MKIILHTGDRYPGDGPDAKRMRTFYEVFTEHGHEVSILAPRMEHGIPAPKGAVLCPALPLKSKSTINRMLNGLSFGISSVIASLKLGKTDVVITTCPPALISPFGWLIAKCKGAKLIYDVRDIWPDVAWEMGSFAKNSIYSRIFSFIRDFMLKHADLTTAVSEGKVKKLKAYHPRRDVIEIANGFDTHFLENRDMPELMEQFHLGETFTCVYMGNLGLAQGLGQILYVARKAKETGMDAQFLLFGDGVESGKLKKYAGQHGLDNVRFPGRIPGEKIYTVLRHAQMSFIPLASDRLADSVPTKLYEALGAGCPVLLAAAGDAEKILRESGLGIAVRPNDEEALWNGFCQMYQSSDVFMENREKARMMMRTTHSLRSSAEKLEEELELRYGKKEEGLTESGRAGAA